MILALGKFYLANDGDLWCCFKIDIETSVAFAVRLTDGHCACFDLYGEHENIEWSFAVECKLVELPSHQKHREILNEMLTFSASDIPKTDGYAMYQIEVASANVFIEARPMSSIPPYDFDIRSCTMIMKPEQS